MDTMNYFDLDGTIANYNWNTAGETRINPLMKEFCGRSIGIITNQGGLSWGWCGIKRGDGGEYPTIEDFKRRINDVLTMLRNEYGIIVAEIHICVYHPGLSTKVANAVSNELMLRLNGIYPRVYIYDTPEARKPGVDMFWGNIDCYFGDSADDMVAAASAGVPHEKWERFV